jgi:hypothetical protein
MPALITTMSSRPWTIGEFRWECGPGADDSVDRLAQRHDAMPRDRLLKHVAGL